MHGITDVVRDGWIRTDMYRKGLGILGWRGDEDGARGSDSTTEGLLLLMRRVKCGCTNNIIKVRKRRGAEAEGA